MMKGASRAVLETVERAMHEAWRTGREEGRQEVAEFAVREILTARFGPEAQWMGAVVKFLPGEELAEIVVLAATCPDPGIFYARPYLPKRKRRRSSRDRDHRAAP